MSDTNDNTINANVGEISFGERLSRYLSRTFTRNGTTNQYHRLPEDTAQNMPGAFPSSEQSSIQGQGQEQLQITNNGSGIMDKVIFCIFVPLYMVFKVLQVMLLFMIDRLPSALNRSSSVRKKGTNPGDVARDFIYNFDKRIGNIVHYGEGASDSRPSNEETENDLLIPSNDVLSIPRPDFLECSCSQALYFTKKDIRWLLVYIHSDENEESDTFINEVLLNPRFLNYIKSKDFLVWGGDIKNSECFQVANVHNITKLPFLGLLCLTVKTTPTSSGVIQSSPTLSLVCQLEGLHANTDTPVITRALKLFDKAYNKLNPTLISLRAEQRERNLARDIRTQQDMAYNEGLERDRQRREERLQREEESRRQRELELKRTQWLKWRKAQLLPEVAMNSKGEYARVAIRLVDGQRITFRFNKECKLEEIYAYIECLYLNEVEDVGDLEHQPPINYEHQYKFKLYQAIPRELLECSMDLTIKDNELVWPNGNLMVEMD